MARSLAPSWPEPPSSGGPQQVLDDLAHTAGVVSPRLRSGPKPLPQADPRLGTITIPADLALASLPAQRGVLAHELAHTVLHRPTRTWRAQLVVLGTILGIGLAGAASYAATFHTPDPWPSVAVLACLLAGGAVLARSAAWSRGRERQADDWALALVGPASLTAALHWIAARVDDPRGVARLLATHPATAQRLARLSTTEEGRSRDGRRPSEDTERSAVPQRPLTGRSPSLSHHRERR